jgi:hypothetical protein
MAGFQVTTEAQARDSTWLSMHYILADIQANRNERS